MSNRLSIKPHRRVTFKFKTSKESLKMSNSVRNTISVRDNRESITHFMLLICNILGVYLLVILKKNRTSLKLLNYCYTDIVREKICDDFLTIHMKILCDFQIVLFYIPVCWYVVLFKDKEIRRVSHNFLKKNNDFFPTSYRWKDRMLYILFLNLMRMSSLMMKLFLFLF